jgi:cytochrome P450
VVKETLRLGTATYASSPYITVQDADICDVKVSKGTAVYIDIGKISLIIAL